MKEVHIHFLVLEDSNQACEYSYMIIDQRQPCYVNLVQLSARRQCTPRLPQTLGDPKECLCKLHLR